jgi:hypothetical protein|tara:strand:- start:522 stop:824 length:303 start_codon:yes stop_codon:yes gene_type:complete
MTDETENRGHAFNQARTPIPRKPKPKSIMTDENLISEEAEQETVQTEEVKDVAEQEEVLESSSIEKRLAAIEEQMEVTNKYLSAIDWKIWLYLKAENYIE